MSRFFANVDEEEEEQKEELVPIKEESEKPADEDKKGGKKKKKGKGDKPEGEAPPEAKEAKEVKEEEEKEKDDKKKDKKKKGPAAEIQRKIEEQRRAQREKWSAVFLSVANDYHRQQIELNLEFFREYVRKTKADLKKQERKEKNLGMKDRKNWERQEEARQMMEQMLRENQKDLSQLTGPVANKRRKKPGQADSKAAEKEENKGDNGENNQPEEGVKTEEVKKVPENTKSEEKKGENVDADLDWETQVEDVVPERKPSAASKAPAPAPITAPVAASKPQPPKKAPESKADPEDPKNAKNKVQEIAKQIISREYEAFNVKSKYRCPIICIMGHVDTGKTKILDQIRQTNVQVNEAGGITQQIGASFFPQTKLKEQISKLDAKALKVGCEIPGLLVIDTPGHEAFANLRNRGSSLCDMAIVVVDIMHGLERQTIESLKMLHEKQTPYIIALNKIDRIYGWKQAKDTSSFVNLQKQASATKTNFEEKKLSTLTQLMKEGIHSTV